MKAVLRKLLIDSNVWYVFIPSAILVIFSGVIIPMLLYRFVLKKTPDYKTFIWIVAFINNNLKF